MIVCVSENKEVRPTSLNVVRDEFFQCLTAFQIWLAYPATIPSDHSVPYIRQIHPVVYCITKFATASRCPVQPLNLPRNLNPGPKSRKSARVRPKRPAQNASRPSCAGCPRTSLNRSFGNPCRLGSLMNPSSGRSFILAK